MRISRLVAWNTTPKEHMAAYPSDAYVPLPRCRLTRAVNVQAPADVTFRWICQLKLAPYSYDWIDNLGRRSPAQLRPGTEHLAKGQHFMLFEIADFVPGRHLTGTVRPRLQAIAGRQAITYLVVATSPQSSRIIVCIDLPTRSWLDRLRFSGPVPVFAAADLFMMRRQLYNLKCYAERDTHAAE